MNYSIIISPLFRLLYLFSPFFRRNKNKTFTRLLFFWGGGGAYFWEALTFGSLLRLKFSGSASNHTPRSIWACYSHMEGDWFFFRNSYSTFTLVQRYLKVVAFHATMFIILSETLCKVAFQENFSILFNKYQRFLLKLRR